MLDKHAHLFGIGAAGMTEFKFLCAEFSASGDAPVNDDLRNVANHVTDQLKRACILSDMDQFVAAIDRFSYSINETNRFVSKPASQIATEAKILLQSLWDYLENEFYFHIRTSDYLIFSEANPFGPKMPDVLREDISEAAKCLALQRPTACVFHLMRLMEHAVHVFAKRIRVAIPSAPRDQTWAKIINLVNKKIDSLPTKTKAQLRKKYEYATLSSHLNSVRIATRNEVMHPKQTYTLQEAHDIYNATRLFMRQLVDSLGLS